MFEQPHGDPTLPTPVTPTSQFPPPPPPPPPTEQFPVQAPPPPAPAGDRAAAAPSKRRWPGSAKAAVGVLALTTIGGGVWGATGASSASDKSDRLEALTADLDDAEQDAGGLTDEVADLKGQLADATAQATAAANDLSAAQADAAAAHGQVELLSSLFPLNVADPSGMAVDGTYSLTHVPDAAVCEGYADLASACVPANFPDQFQLQANPDGTYAMSSPSGWFAPITLSSDGTSVEGDGQLSDQAASQCNGAPVPTSVHVTLVLSQVGLDVASGPRVVGNAFVGRMEISGAQTDTCSSDRRASNFSGTRVG